MNRLKLMYLYIISQEELSPEFFGNEKSKLEFLSFDYSAFGGPKSKLSFADKWDKFILDNFSPKYYFLFSKRMKESHSQYLDGFSLERHVNLQLS